MKAKVIKKEPSQYELDCFISKFVEKITQNNEDHYFFDLNSFDLEEPINNCIYNFLSIVQLVKPTPIGILCKRKDFKKFKKEDKFPYGYRIKPRKIKNNYHDLRSMVISEAFITFPKYNSYDILNYINEEFYKVEKEENKND